MKHYFRPYLVSALGLALICSAGSQAFAAPVRRVNIPHFSGPIPGEQAAVFWYGVVNSTENFSDVRIAYNDQELWVNVAVYDRWLWEDDSATRTPDSLTKWDATTLLLSTTKTPGALPQNTDHRLVGELSWWRPRTDYQASYHGNGSTWVLDATSFTTTTGWRGNAPNDTLEDRGWVIFYEIPFGSLGLSGPPAPGTVWRLAVMTHDRDDAAATPIPDKVWPEIMSRDQPASWAEISFGTPTYVSPPVSGIPQTVTIRDKLNGAVVQDADVGGSSVCGDGLDFWTQWGDTNYAGKTFTVVQNEGDISDWPCFSKIYVDFPLHALPAGQTISSATLRFYQFGNSDPSQAQPSLIQVMTVAEDWSESTITWNNAPLALENVSSSWVDPVNGTIVWPGWERDWDLSYAVAQAYAAHQTVLRLALYSADFAYHSGKYFSSSESGDWDEVGRPTLMVTLGGPAGSPAAPRRLRAR